MIVLIHLLFIVAGALIALGTLTWFARVTGGFYSLAGFIAIALLALSAFLVLVGFGVVGFPGLETVT